MIKLDFFDSDFGAEFNINEFYSTSLRYNLTVLMSLEHLINKKLQEVGFYQLESIRTLGTYAKSNNKKMLVVGGFIRDVINQKPTKDIDLVTDIDIDKLTELLSSYNAKETGKHFLVLNFKDQMNFEISNFRKDRDNQGGLIGTIEEDAQRRDFTLNSLYFDILEGHLVDPNGALDDCIEGIIKFVGNPKERINEDPLRILRFYKFIKKGFIPDPRTLRVIRSEFQEIFKVHPERIRNEIEFLAGI